LTPLTEFFIFHFSSCARRPFALRAFPKAFVFIFSWILAPIDLESGRLHFPLDLFDEQTRRNNSDLGSPRQFVLLFSCVRACDRQPRLFGGLCPLRSLWLGLLFPNIIFVPSSMYGQLRAVPRPTLPPVALFNATRSKVIGFQVPEAFQGHCFRIAFLGPPFRSVPRPLIPQAGCSWFLFLKKFAFPSPAGPMCSQPPGCPFVLVWPLPFGFLLCLLCWR